MCLAQKINKDSWNGKIHAWILSPPHRLWMIYVIQFKFQWQKLGMGNTNNRTKTHWTWFLPITWSQHFNDMESESAANQPSIRHKYHWSTLWERPSNLHPTTKIKLYIHKMSFNKVVMKELQLNANNDLSSGFLSKTIESARKMDMSSLYSCLTLSVCINKIPNVRWEVQSKQ